MKRLWETIKFIMFILVLVFIGGFCFFGSAILFIPLVLAGIGAVVIAVARDPPPPDPKE